ncbi:MAG TPA: hypothetical protein VG488_08805 [Candidatus Angelobacter sp.]|nr:hypothetical protein [Candidatus Angelobacter sp.]
MPQPSPGASGALTEKKLKFIEAWQGNATAAARAAGYCKPEVVACIRHGHFPLHPGESE